MSIRTVIEINHDRLHYLREHPKELDAFLHSLGGCDVTGALNRGEIPHQKPFLTHPRFHTLTKIVAP